MEEGRTELEFDEFEKLLGEIPNATSGNTHSEESGTKNASLSPICVNSCKGPLSDKLHNNGRMDEGKNSAKKIQKSPVKRVQREVTNLPDDQSLTSALAGLSFDGAVNMEAGSHFENCKSLQNYFSMDGQIPNSLKMQVSSMDTPVMVVPSFQAPNNIPCGFYEFDVTNSGQESSKMSKFNSEELKKPQAAYSQPIENLSPGVPLAHAVEGFQFLSNVPAPGTRAVQKVIETLKTPEQFSMVVSSLKPGIVMLIKNTNGNHVAQRCLQYLTREYREFLFVAATTNCVELATDRHGCCVLQKCLSHSDAEQRNRLICKITSNALILSQDPFGNYVVQFVFELQLPWATLDILDQLEGNYGDLSVQKYSSNVVEKSLKYACEERRIRIIQELIENPRLDQVMQDPYGNYVVQAALSQSKGILHSKLVDAIKPHMPVLRTSPYGKKILSSNILKK
ncbi:hypothetical protein C1H46_026926 [Malus baccata]|uniref:PUM-HD domain-containing protein n=1 Tax=Malus baccata TaxID=106549 RepID=A0A540LMF5_MALBA|nr:hypothetical protein C1H46_026926 [Malus baccata]